MKRNRIVFILITCILAVIAGFLVFSSGKKGTFRKSEYHFAVEDTSSITKIFMADKNNRSVLLERKGISEWDLNQKFNARKSGIDMLLHTLYFLAPKAPVPLSGHDNVIAQMASQSIKVEVYQIINQIDIFGIKAFPREKRTKTFYVGSGTQDNRGTFMLMEGAEVPFIVHLHGLRGYLAPRFSTREEDWRDHTIFRNKLHEIRSIAVDFIEEPEKSVKIDNTGTEFFVINPSTNDTLPGYDTLNLYNFVTAFADLRYEALLNDMDINRKDSIINSSPFHKISLTTTNGDVTVVKTFHKPNDMQKYDMEGRLYTHDLDRLYALINEDRDWVLIQFFVFDRILQPLDYFRWKG